MDIGSWRELALGIVGWTPDVFWSATMLELSDAYIGRCKVNGWGRWAINETGVSAAGFEQMLDGIEALKQRFPDGPGKRLNKAEKRALRG